jgi:predicted membrane chloride channel (bestrophin family)
MGDIDHVDKMVRYIIAFAVTTKRHLRSERDLVELRNKEVLTQEQIAGIQSAKHMPNMVLQVLSDTIQSAKRQGLLSDIEAMSLDANLTQVGAQTKWRQFKLLFVVVGSSPLATWSFL